MGEPDVDRLLERISGEQLLEWQAWELVNGPLGSRRQDYYLAQLACIQVNMHRARGQKPHQIEDFLLFDRPERRRAEFKGAEMLEFLKAWSGYGRQ